MQHVKSDKQDLKEKEAEWSPLSNGEDLTNGGTSSLSSKNRVGVLVQKPIPLVMCWMLFLYGLVVSPWKHPKPGPGPGQQNFPGNWWALSGANTTKLLPWLFFILIWSAYENSRCFWNLSVVFIWCVYMLYKSLKIKSQGVVSRYKFHPQLWGNCGFHSMP